MFKAIIFDCFDVLVTSGLTPFLRNHLAHEPAKRASILQLEESLNAGQVNYETFLLKISETSGVPLEAARREMDDNEPDEELFGYITSLKPRYKLGLLSNAGDDWLDEMLGTERRSLFDAIVLSYRVGITKPQPEIYNLIAKKLNVSPKQCIMIDDRELYCVGALSVGMQAIQYRSFAQMKRELEDLLN